ncbi:EAL domain-containing protein [Paenibacillus sp. NPDC058071]|uniref:bifunctional diguanylate cyclase/phosphodiesterase n=1 Tax=Paenibacillus sp. NPDC058071 TaxID=3346326 RepID=UPI0036DC39A0
MEALVGDYNKWIVLLSFVIAMLASYSALHLVFKISNTKGKARQGWMAASAFVMGSGIWTMHFVGMIAFHIGIPVTYDVPITLLSILAAIFASYIAFYLTMSKKAGKWTLAGGGIAMGLGIATMHYTGMASMRSPGMVVTYDPLWRAMSVVIAIIVAYAALFLFIKFRAVKGSGWPKWAASALMGLAIGGMHYSGMRASEFWCGDDVSLTLMDSAPLNLFLLIGVSLAILLIMLVTWGAIYFDRTVLERMAFSDPLTGLSNRHAMNRYFEDALDGGAVTSNAVFFLDLDQFKIINDTLGHDVGDLLVQAAAERLLAFKDESSEVFRLGGDEFLFVIQHMDEQSAAELAEKMLESIRQPYMLEGNELYITGSIGISFSPQHGVTRSALLMAADTAMYQAKKQGKNQYCIYNDELDKQSTRRMELEKDLQTALVHEQFVIHYQPKWDADTSRPVGFEALLRWNHPSLGMISPDEFIPIAEETGAIIAITRWVLEKAAIDCVSWNVKWREKLPGGDELGVSVNLSVKVFDSKNLHDMVLTSLSRSGLAPSLLELEITESIVMHNLEDVTQQLGQLRELGIIISMDDFGSGYSSLGSIDKIPFHTIKIDKLFMEQSDSAVKRAVVQTIVVLAQQLNLGIIAEGVETQQQIAFLKETGCNIMQGFYFSRPMPKEQLEGWLSGAVEAAAAAQSAASAQTVNL